MVSILDNSITHAHTYVIVILCVPVATHDRLPSQAEIYISLSQLSTTSMIFYFLMVKLDDNSTLEKITSLPPISEARSSIAPVATYLGVCVCQFVSC